MTSGGNATHQLNDSTHVSQALGSGIRGGGGRGQQMSTMLCCKLYSRKAQQIGLVDTTTYAGHTRVLLHSHSAVIWQPNHLKDRSASSPLLKLQVPALLRAALPGPT